jgi:hypothetical protein
MKHDAIAQPQNHACREDEQHPKRHITPRFCERCFFAPAAKRPGWSKSRPHIPRDRSLPSSPFHLMGRSLGGRSGSSARAQGCHGSPRYGSIASLTITERPDEGAIPWHLHVIYAASGTRAAITLVTPITRPSAYLIRTFRPYGHWWKARRNAFGSVPAACEAEKSRSPSSAHLAPLSMAHSRESVLPVRSV